MISIVGNFSRTDSVLTQSKGYWIILVQYMYSLMYHPLHQRIFQDLQQYDYECFVMNLTEGVLNMFYMLCLLESKDVSNV